MSGQSGAPLLSNDENIIAIHNGGALGTKEFNIGRLLTSETLEEICIWIKHLDGDPIAVYSDQCGHPEGVTQMKRCDCSLDSISLSAYINLVELHLPSNNLMSVSTDSLSYLTYLLLSDNQLSSVDLTNNIQLTYLNVSNNRLRSISLNNPSLAYLYLSNNSLGEIDLSTCKDLSELYISNNKLDEIDLFDN